jgi:anti-sigma-K factor RskA
MNIWTEFKNAILPWLIAAGVVGLLMFEHRRTTAALVDTNQQLAEAVEVQGRALEGVRDLLAKQGYTLPPLDASR